MTWENDWKQFVTIRMENDYCSDLIVCLFNHELMIPRFSQQTVDVNSMYCYWSMNQPFFSSSSSLPVDEKIVQIIISF